jgi:hypothetical protein
MNMKCTPRCVFDQRSVLNAVAITNDNNTQFCSQPCTLMNARLASVCDHCTVLNAAVCIYKLRASGELSVETLLTRTTVRTAQPARHVGQLHQETFG